MPVLDDDIIIKLYHEKVKKDFPELSHLSFTEIEAICKSVFRHVKNNMNDPKLPTIMLRYFGKFTVYACRFKTMMTHNNNDLKFGRITQERHDEIEADCERRMEEVKVKNKVRLRTIKIGRQMAKAARMTPSVELIDDIEEEEEQNDKD